MHSSTAFASPRAEINVTPLVDVVLVLLIIFMVITPFLGDPFYVSIPKTAGADAPAARRLLTVSLETGGAITLNGAPVLRADLERRLAELFALGAEHQVLFEGSDQATHGDAADVMDRIRNAKGRVAIALAEDAVRPAPLPRGEGADKR